MIVWSNYFLETVKMTETKQMRMEKKKKKLK